MSGRFPCWLAAFALAVAMLGGAPASAAPLPITSAAAGTIHLDVGKGRLLRLDKPATSVFIADPDVADVQVKSPTVVYVFGKGSGTTTLYAVGEKDEVLLSAEVAVSYDVSRLAQAIHQLVPRSAVKVSAVEDSVVLSGTVYSATDGDDVRKIAARFVSDPKQILNEMRVDAPNQVNLRVRVAEVSRKIIKELGVNWNAAFNAGSRFPLFGIASSLPFAQAPNTQFKFHYLSGSQGTADLNPVIDALEQHGLVTVLAEPNLTAVSGEPANFLAGGEFPVPVPQTSTSGTFVTIDWKKFGVSLNFVATVVADNRISLHVMPEVSQLSSDGAININGFVVPALTTRRADTTVELGSGQSFAIAGLLQNNVSQDINKFPGLGDVPVLGALFRSQSFQRNESELVILVTPYLVHPIAAANLARLPTDGYQPSSDVELFGEGKEYRRQPVAGRSLAQRGTALIGPIGFDLD